MAIVKFKTTPTQALHKGRIKQEVAKLYGTSLEVAKKEILGQYHLVWLFALREEFGFADSRARRVLNKFLEISEDIASGLITFDDLKEVIKDEIGEKFYNDFLRNEWEVRD